MLNWEKDKARHKAIEVSPDYLPRTGSWADMRRWEIENRQSCGTSHKKTARSKKNISPNEATHYLNQLALYVKCVHSTYFWRKPIKDRNEVLMIIGKYIRKINSFNNRLNFEDTKLVQEANLIISKGAH